MMDKSKQIETVFVIVLGLVAVYWFNRWNGWLIAAFVIGFVSLLVPVFRSLVYRGWTGLSMLMGELMGRIMLTLVYILILLPLSLVVRKKLRQGIRNKAGDGSYFTERNHTYDKKDLTNLW